MMQCAFSIRTVFSFVTSISEAALHCGKAYPSTLIHYENGAFRKCSSKRRNLKTRALRFSVNRKYLKTDLFSDTPRKRDPAVIFNSYKYNHNPR